MTDRKTVWVVVLALALGWYLGHSPASPVGPPARPDRPILRALADVVRVAARWGLWVAVFAEPAPARAEQLVRVPAVDAEGHRVIDHAEGW